MSDAPITPEGYAPNPESVKRWQAWLRDQGLYDGPVDGVWSDETFEAVVALQEQNDLGTSGRIDDLSTQAFAADYRRTHGQGGQPDAVREEVKKLYGAAMVAYLDHPEIGKIIRQAAADKLDAGRLQGLLQQTDWWKNTQESARTWDEDNLADPESANARRRAKLAVVHDLASQVGVDLSDELKHQITEDALRFGLSDREVNDLVTSFAVYDPKKVAGGNLAVSVDQLRQAARRYYLTPTEKELFDQAQRIARGELTLDSAITLFKEQAKLNHPALAATIDAGNTVEDYFAETKRRIADALEIDTEQIDLMNDRRFWPVMGFVDGKGRRRPMTWSETIQFVNRMPEADGTARLNQKAAELGQVFRQTFMGVN